MKKSDIQNKVSKKAQWIFEAILDITFDYYGKSYAAIAAGKADLNGIMTYVKILKHSDNVDMIGMLEAIMELKDAGLITLSKRFVQDYGEIKQVNSVFFPMTTRRDYYIP